MVFEIMRSEGSHKSTNTYSETGELDDDFHSFWLEEETRMGFNS